MKNKILINLLKTNYHITGKHFSSQRYLHYRLNNQLIIRKHEK